MGFDRAAQQFLIALLCIATAHGAAVTLPTGTVTTSDTTNQTNYTCGTFTPTSGAILVVFTSTTGTTVAGSMTDTQGLGFTRITTALFATSAGIAQVFVSNATAAASADTVTLNGGGAGTGSNISVLQVTGLSGTGSSAVVQSAIQSNLATASIPNPAFGSAANTNNPTLGMVTNGVNPAGLTAPSGWTQQANIGFNTPTCGLQSVSRDNGFSGTTVTWGSTVGGSLTGGAIIVEMLASTGISQNQKSSFLAFFPR